MTFAVLNDKDCVWEWIWSLLFVVEIGRRIQTTSSCVFHATANRWISFLSMFPFTFDLRSWILIMKSWSFIWQYISNTIKWFVSFLPGIPTSSLTQVVHSAGRRFIVSPVPESRLRESKVFTSEIPDTGKKLLLPQTSINLTASLLYWKAGYQTVVQMMT